MPALPDGPTIGSPSLVHERELALIARLGELPNVIESAAKDYAPHVLAFYLKDLSADFHSYSNAERILVDDERVRVARLALAWAVREDCARAALPVVGRSLRKRTSTSRLKTARALSSSVSAP